MKRFGRGVSWLMLAIMLLTTPVSALYAQSETKKAAAAPTRALETTTSEAKPIIRPAIVRAGLWKLRREMRKAGRHEDAAMITQVLRSSRAMDAVAESVCIQFAEDNPAGVPGDWVDQLTKLIEWLIANADEIMKLIMLIISLFEPAPENTAAMWNIPPPSIYAMAA